MKRINTFDQFLITEALINRSSNWPEDWKNTSHWKLMELLGFVDTSTPQLQKNGTIKINSEMINSVYPDGLILQKSGYIRNPLVTSGFVRKFNSGFALADMFEYIVKRFTPKGVKDILPQDRNEIDSKMLDQLFLENPLLISILDKNPELQQEIISRTGMKDFRSLQAALKNPIW